MSSGVTNPAYTPLGKKVDLSRETQGTLPPTSGAILSAYNLGVSTDGVGVFEGEDVNAGLAFFRLQSGPGVQITPSSNGHALVITSTVLAGNTPGVMLQNVYDPTASGTVNSANTANIAPWNGITGKPATFPPTLPITESNVTNLVSDLASKVPVGRSINTAFSLEGGGSLTTDLTLSLIGDMANVGPDMRYGTDPSGVLGWYPASVGAGDMTQEVYDKNHDGIVDIAAAVSAGGVTGAMLSSTAVTDSLGYTPVNKAGDTMIGQLILQLNGPNIYPNMYQQAQLLAQVSSTGAGYPTIGLSRQASGGGAVAIWYNSGHADLNLEYADGTTATLISSISKISGSQLIAGSVPAGALSVGAAVANIGYRPVNWNGDSMVNTGVFNFQNEAGLAAQSWGLAPLRVSCTTGNARPQMGFYYPGEAVSFYFEPTDWSMRFIGSDGVDRIIWDNQHNLVLNPGRNLYIEGALVTTAGGYFNLGQGTPAYLDGEILNRSGSYQYIQSGATWVMQSGSVGYIQGGAMLIVQGTAAPGGGQIQLNGDQALYAVGNPQEVTIINECGLAANSYGLSTLYIRTTGGGGRPGLALHHAGYGYGCFLFFDTDHKMKFVDNTGTIHVITSS